MNDSWLGGIAYEKFMGRWSALVARQFLSWLAGSQARTWLDVGCGTGSLTQCIIDEYRPGQVISIDSSIDLISHAKRSIANPAVHFGVGLAECLPLRSNSVDAVVSGLVLNFVPQPGKAVAEMLRVCRAGAQIGIFVWDYADGMRMLRHFWDAAVKLDPGAQQADEGERFPLCQPGQLEALVREARLKQVEAAPVEVMTVFRDFDDYWQPFLGGAGPASRYLMSLPDAHRQRLKQALLQRLPTDDQGRISLMARAWAVKGTA